MRINTNVNALGAARNVFVNNLAARSSMNRLSSGLRIASAADDAAGLTIANKLRTQARGLTQAATNAEQGRAMLQIAEGAAVTVQQIVERQKELVVQREQSATNGAVTGALGAEIVALQAEANRIVAEANFQGTNVFNTALVFQVSDQTANGTLSINTSITLTALTGASTLAQADTAQDLVNSLISTIGVSQNVMDMTVRNLKSAVVNVRAAEGTIRDADMAEEMANLTRNNILLQAAQAMLSQANQSSQGITSILR
ncbi:MAG: flagellin [Gemmatimonadetes bacterium]|nr:flagellin [Gemmatimonadota bacterium]